MSRGEGGQSLVEFALVAPLLLLMLLGMADLGRAFYYTSAVASAARSGAAAYAVDRGADLQSRACGALGTSCAATVVASCPNAPVGGAVQVIYHFELVSEYLVGRIVDTRHIDIRACATYPRSGP